MILLVQTFPRAMPAFKRHWPYFTNSGADEIIGIGTTDGGCEWPGGIAFAEIGEDKYISGNHLPNRLIDTVEYGLKHITEHIMVCEYDTLFFNPIRYQEMQHAFAAHLGGFKTWGSIADRFFHNPWLFTRDGAEQFVEEGRKAIADNVCGPKSNAYGTAECSPDVFFGLVCQRLGLEVQYDLWKQFSQNSLDKPGALEDARTAYRHGFDVIHGCKTESELIFITT